MEEEVSNIVSFPEDRIIRDYPNDNSERREKADIKYTENVVNFIIDEIVETLENNGLDWKEETSTDLTLVSDTLTSMIYRMLDKHHPIQDQIKVVEDDDEDSEKNLESALETSA